MAVSPPVQLAAEKQRRLCLVAGHIDCATFGAATASRAETARVASRSRPIARMTPVILDHGRFDLRIPAFRADRTSGQALLVAVLGVAFLAILLTRPSDNAGVITPPGSQAAASAGVGVADPTDVAAAPSASPSEASPPVETTQPATSEAPSNESAAPGSAGPSSGASAEPATSGETYRVKSGDTLSAIAARFGTTTRVLVRLNGIADPSKLRVGQVLKLP